MIKRLDSHANFGFSVSVFTVLVHAVDDLPNIRAREPFAELGKDLDELFVRVEVEGRFAGSCGSDYVVLVEYGRSETGSNPLRDGIIEEALDRAGQTL